MTYSPGPRNNAPKTVRLEDQPLPDREVAFYTPRAGDWLLLAVLVLALLGIGARVWSQLGWGDVVGRAIFCGLLLLAIYWTALIYTFKLSLAARVGPQGLAIVRGPWRVELRWSEITRLMERPQVTAGRRYRWVVALARDGRRLQVREDALLDYERFRREVYERYRMWRDHGGTWGATGGGPFVAREAVGAQARWWGFNSLMVAILGAYLAFILPGGQLVGSALLALALLGGLLALVVLARRRVYALDGRMVESRGLVGRVQLAWRDISKVERTRHPASGVILAVVALGRFALRLAARGDTGIRGFAWAPRVPEYVTLRGGGRHARIRLHYLAQPEELLAWVEFYAGLRRAANSRPLEARAEAEQATPRHAVASSGPLRQSSSSGPLRQPAAAAMAPEVEAAPDLSGVSGPLDPWGGARRGDIVDAPAASASSPLHGAVPEVAHEPAAPEPVFRGAPLGASFQEPAGLDLPPEFATQQTGGGQDSEAWLRETGALLSMSGVSGMSGEPPSDHVVDHQVVDADPADMPSAGPLPPPITPPITSPVTPAARARAPHGQHGQNGQHGPQFVRPPGPSRGQAGPAAAGSRGQRPPAGPRVTKQVLPDLPATPGATRPSLPDSAFPPYVPNTPTEEPAARPGTPQSAPVEDARGAPPAPTPAATPGDDDLDFGDPRGEDWIEAEPAQPAPWLQEGWQPPALPRFGPQAQQAQQAQPEEGAPRRDGGAGGY